MKIEARVIGDKEVLRAMQELERKNKSAMAKAVTKSCQVVEGHAKDNAPHVLGHLRASITYQLFETPPDKVSGRIGTNLLYGPYVEFGTRKPHLAPIARRYAIKYGIPVPKGKQFVVIKVSGEAQPYLYPALRQSIGQIKSIFINTLKEANT